MNLGNPGEFTIAELADLVVELTGTSSPLSGCRCRPMTPIRRQPDITLAKQVLGWQPNVQLREGACCARSITSKYRQRIIAGAPQSNQPDL